VVVLALLALATVLPRWLDLGDAPLDPAEASHAIASWWAASGRGASIDLLEPGPDSSLLVGLESVVFWLAGAAGDGLARFPTAFAGVALVGLPLALRPTIASALPLAILLAVDPWLLSASRRADGAVLAAAAAIACHLLLGRLANASPGPALATVARRQWILWASAAGLLFVSGAAAWDFLPPVLAAAVLLSARRGGLPPPSPRPPLTILLGAGAMAALLGSTAMLVQWEGPGLVTVSLDSWLASWGRSVAGATASAPGAGLPAIAYGSMLVGLAAWGLGRAWRRAPSTSVAARRLDGEGLALWLGWGVLIQLRDGAGTALALAVPLALAAARGLEEIGSPALTTRGGWPPAQRALLLVVGSLGLAGALHRSLALDRRTTLEPVRRLAADIAVLEQRPGAERPRIEVQSAPRVDAVLAWYLRDAAVRWVAAPLSGDIATPGVAVLRRPEPADPDAFSAGYAVTRRGDALTIIELR
jgi:hypothetical protein